MFSRMKPRPREATISVIAPRSRSGLKVTWSMAMQAATVIIAPTAKFGNLSTPKSSVTARAGSVMMTPVITPLKSVCTEIELVQVLHAEHRIGGTAAPHAAAGEHDAGVGDAQR